MMTTATAQPETKPAAGTDHAPIIEAFADKGPIHIIHFDAHLDFVDERHGVRYGHGNPLRRASEMIPEFVGKSYLPFFNYLLIMILRKRDWPEHAPALFNRLWR